MKPVATFRHHWAKETFFEAHAPTKSQIGDTVRALRKKRGLTQRELANVLAVSQSNLSEIESGKASLSAEQFIVLLKYFNVPATVFEPTLADEGGTIQKALAAHGAYNLVEDPSILPSERLAQVETVIREVLVEGGPARSLTALAPVLFQNIDKINFTRLYARIRDLNLDLRFLWLLDNVLEAFRLEKEATNDRKLLLAITKAENVLQRHRITANLKTPPPKIGLNGALEEDSLDQSFASNQSVKEVRQKSSSISRHWGILTTLQPQDFAHTLSESRHADTH
ncbi:MAG: helix-turn-helix transcriptional regulator [Acidobacteria bacterium]|nr:helix-turn-helix transcriptional regulator [Acidobacteriota bacterium]MBI3488135.1 helix-turn-helix transcriptional regulator [Acidobacteriota bacterium]